MFKLIPFKPTSGTPTAPTELSYLWPPSIAVLPWPAGFEVRMLFQLCGDVRIVRTKTVTYSEFGGE